MKILKKFSVFCLAFLTGFVLVATTGKDEIKLSKNSASAEISETNSKKYSVSQTDETAALEVIKEITESDKDDFSRYRIKLLETGEGFHGSEVEAKSGEIWSGLFREKDGYVVRPVKIKIRRVFDEYLDEEKNAKTGKDIIVNGKNQPVFLLKNAGEVKAGKVTTLFQGLTWKDVFEDEDSALPPEEMLTTLKKDFSKQFEMGGKKYDLKVIEAKNFRNEKIFALTLESGNLRQVIHTMKADPNFDLGHLYWVGDLDRDGKPDFYFDLFEHYNVMNRVLYLSSFAQDGELISTAAYFWTTGC